MSVHLSHVEFSPQFTDEDEAELEREEWEQQQDLKEFLEREMGDDTFEVSFASYHSQSNHSSEKLSQKNNGDTQILGIKENLSDGFQNGRFESHQLTPVNGMSNSHRNYVNSNGYRSSSSNNIQYVNTNSPPQDLYNISSHYAAEDAYSNGMVPNEGYQTDGKQYIEDSQLCVLYNARGKKIESLEKQKEEQKEKFSKEIRVLQHKLTMVTSEKDGLASSNQQQQNIIIEHKQQISLLEKELIKEQEGKNQLDKKIEELNEKLYASDCAVDTLQQQIKQINQTESMSRARAQHESMLATIRQRHDEEILTLKEKLDDLQQALSWKTEDVNRYREMLDSNSSVSEIGILRNRLGQEEKKTKELQAEMERNHSKYLESEEQLKLYEGLLKMQAAQLTSTPLNAFSGIKDKDELDKTPCTINPRSQDKDTIGPSDSSFRDELVKSLSINREKRQQIHVLRDQLEYFQKQLHGKSNISVEDRDTQTTAEANALCDQCEKVQCLLDEKIKEFDQLSKSSKDEAIQLEKDKAELRANMADMVKNFDQQKVNDMQSQNKATLQLIDDVKANLVNEIKKVHEEEKKQLHNDIESLNGELLHTKEEYLNLCTEVKDLEDHLRKEFDVERKRELDELRQSLEIQHSNQLSKQEVNLTNKFFEDLENEKLKWKEETEKENADKIEKSVMLAKTDWIESYNTKRGDNVNEKERSDVNHLHEKCQKLEEKIKELEMKCSEQQEDFNVQLEAAKVALEDEQRTGLDEKIAEIQQDVETKEKEKMESDLHKAIKQCNDKYAEETKKLQASLNEQTSVSRKIELDFKLKTALWNRTESEMKRKIESLRKEASKKCEKCLQIEEGSDCKESSPQHKDMCDNCFVLFKNHENLWYSREKELLDLLEEAQDQIKFKLSELKSMPIDPSSSPAVLDGELKPLPVSKEREYKEILDKMAGEVKQWKDRWEESETRNTDMNNNILSIRDDIVFTESCYERQLNSLQKQLAKAEEDLMETKKELSCEKVNGKELSDKNEILEKKKIEMEHDINIAKSDKSTLEKKYKGQFDCLQDEITDLKKSLFHIQKEYGEEKEKYIKLRVDYDKLSETSIAGDYRNSLVMSKKKIIESEYGNKVKDLSTECSNWKLKYHDVEKENTELDRNLQLQLANVTKTENYFKKQVDTLQSEIEHLKETIAQLQNELFSEKERSNKLDTEFKQMTKNYNINLDNVLNVEKQKWQMESAKLQEAVLKASEIDHNNFVKEIQSQTNHINEINKIKEDHDIAVRNLKQGFREKLSRITEMKKKWIREEEEKRNQIEKKIKEKYSSKFTEIQEQHESILRDQQAHWIKEIHQSKKEHLTALAGLREEVKMKEKLLTKERKTFEEADILSKLNMKELAVKHNQEVEQLKISHLDNLQKEKKRLEQYYKLMHDNPVNCGRKQSIQNCKEIEGQTEHAADKEGYVSDAQDEFDFGGKTRQFYVETLERIQLDVMEHIRIMRCNADIEIREAVERERKKIYHELRERSITTSSPKIDKEEFGSPTFTNSMINASCMAFKDLPHDG